MKTLLKHELPFQGRNLCFFAVVLLACSCLSQLPFFLRDSCRRTLGKFLHECDHASCSAIIATLTTEKSRTRCLQIDSEVSKRGWRTAGVGTGRFFVCQSPTPSRKPSHEFAASKELMRQTHSQGASLV